MAVKLSNHDSTTVASDCSFEICQSLGLTVGASSWDQQFSTTLQLMNKAVCLSWLTQHAATIIYWVPLKKWLDKVVWNTLTFLHSKSFTSSKHCHYSVHEHTLVGTTRTTVLVLSVVPIAWDVQYLWWENIVFLRANQFTLKYLKASITQLHTTHQQIPRHAEGKQWISDAKLRDAMTSW